jgi:hypothetical protein
MALLSSKKRESRKSLSQPGWITLEGGFAARQCVVQDLSATGAKVTIDDPNSLPTKLRLAFSRDARTGRRCEVVWRRGKSVGVNCRARRAAPSSEGRQDRNFGQADSAEALTFSQCLRGVRRGLRQDRRHQYLHEDRRRGERRRGRFQRLALTSRHRRRDELRKTGTRHELRKPAIKVR